MSDSIPLLKQLCFVRLDPSLDRPSQRARQHAAGSKPLPASDVDPVAANIALILHVNMTRSVVIIVHKDYHSAVLEGM